MSGRDWMVYVCRGRADYMPKGTPTTFEVKATDLTLREAIEMTDAHNDRVDAEDDALMPGGFN